MRKFILYLLLGVMSFYLNAQNKLQMAPLNPDYVEYLQRTVLGENTMQTKDGHWLGGIPAPRMPGFQYFEKKSMQKATSFATSYDLRTAGIGQISLLTSVKDQGSCGSCWVFSTMGSIESRWKMLGYGDNDLSENNIKECHGFLWTPCKGGNLQMAAAYLVRKHGPLTETDNPYSVSEQFNCVGGLNEVAYVTDVRYLPNDAAILKQAILDYGALSTAMFFESGYYNSTDYSYYYNGAGITNHLVTLVGWDDNKLTAGGTGAWIIKNSWGESWGESGYFYVSYNDTRVNSFVGYFPFRTEYDPNANLYYYDRLGEVGAFGTGDGNDAGLVKYVAIRNETLNKVGTFVDAANTTISIDIYDDFDGTTLSNLLGSVSNQSIALPGYYSFDIPSPIPLAAGNDFYIRVNYNCPNEIYVIPIEYEYAGYSNPTIEKGVCWASSTQDTGWVPMGSSTIYPYDLCIKAYTTIDNCNTPTTQATSFTASNITDSTMTVSWKRGNGNAVLVVARAGGAVNTKPINGSSYIADSFVGNGSQIESGNYVLYNGTGTSTNLKSMDFGTTYHFGVYEYTTTTNCYLTPALTANAHTTGLLQCHYCASTGSMSYNTGITSVDFNIINNVSSKPDGYTDYTGYTATVYKNTTQTLAVKLNTDGNYTAHAMAWIDWNQNCDFSDAGELYDLGVTTNDSNGISSLSPLPVLIPTTALEGRTRMRVAAKFGINPSLCQTSFDGEVEDYTIIIKQAAGPKSIDIVAGNLCNALTLEEKSAITHLVISGTLDARDFVTLRDSVPNLTTLDIGSATIAAYTGTDGTTGAPNYTYKANVMPTSAFYNPNTFASKEGLTSIKLPTSMTAIGDDAFYFCSGLTIINIPPTVTSIGEWAFYGCTGLTTIDIPHSVLKIGKNAFVYCSAMINIAEENPNYSSSEGVLFNKTKTKVIQCPISKNGNYAIPITVDSIGSKAFWYCKEIAAINIPLAVTVIDDYAFTACNFSTIEIPKSVGSIKNYAFYGCSSLISIKANNVVPIDLSLFAGVFSGVNKTSCILNVPKGSKFIYQTAAQWKDFENIVEKSATDLISISDASIQLYPNPLAENFQIYGIEGNATLKLLDLNGKVVLIKQIVGNEQITLSAIAQGMYILKIITANATVERKLIKK